VICGEWCRRTEIKIKILGDQTTMARAGRQWASGQWRQSASAQSPRRQWASAQSPSVSPANSVKRSAATRMRRKLRRLVVAVAVEEAPTMTPMTILLHLLDLLHLLPSLRPNKKSWIARVSSRGKRAMQAAQATKARWAVTKARWVVTGPTLWLWLWLWLLYALCLLTAPTNLGTSLSSVSV